jgi:hypothetical protein
LRTADPAPATPLQIVLKSAFKKNDRSIDTAPISTDSPPVRTPETVANQRQPTSGCGQAAAYPQHRMCRTLPFSRKPIFVPDPCLVHASFVPRKNTGLNR